MNTDSTTEYAVTRNEQTSRQTHLHRGVYPVWYPEPRGIQASQWQTDVSPLQHFPGPRTFLTTLV